MNKNIIILRTWMLIIIIIIRKSTKMTRTYEKYMKN